MSAANKHKERNAATVQPNRWVNEYGDFLYMYAFMRVQSKEIAEDLVQDTFLSALKALDTFRGESSQLTWMTSILRRKIIDHYRKMSTKTKFNETQSISQKLAAETMIGNSFGA